MKIVVIGGSGLIGSKLVQRLRELGNDVLAASPQSGVNTVTGEGLAPALEGAETVVDVSNSPTFEGGPALEFFLASGGNLLADGEAAGIRHHVALSVVGTERLQASGYFRAKLAQEELIRTSGLPYTILRSTQFFEFMSRIAGGDSSSVRVSPALVAPVAADDVAGALADIVMAAPLGATVELSGPEVFRLSDVVESAMNAKGDNRVVVADPGAVYFGAALGDRTLLPSEAARVGHLRFATWLGAQGLYHVGDTANVQSVGTAYPVGLAGAVERPRAAG
jgi:uncharacterized protein YbjT (DUF2867 family)